MRKSRFSDSQIVAILKESDSGIPVAEICRKKSALKNPHIHY